MNFRQEPPKQNGYYWFVDESYPIPKIAFVDIYGRDYYEPCGGRRDLDNHGTRKHIRWGDEVKVPDCKEFVIEK